MNLLKPYIQGVLLGLLSEAVQAVPLTSERGPPFGVSLGDPVKHRYRDLALFNLEIDGKLRGCDLVRLTLSDVSRGGRIATRTMVV